MPGANGLPPVSEMDRLHLEADARPERVPSTRSQRRSPSQLRTPPPPSPEPLSNPHMMLGDLANNTTARTARRWSQMRPLAARAPPPAADGDSLHGSDQPSRPAALWNIGRLGVMSAVRLTNRVRQHNAVLAEKQKQEVEEDGQNAATAQGFAGRPSGRSRRPRRPPPIDTSAGWVPSAGPQSAPVGSSRGPTPDAYFGGPGAAGSTSAARRPHTAPSGTTAGGVIPDSEPGLREQARLLRTMANAESSAQVFRRRIASFPHLTRRLWKFVRGGLRTSIHLDPESCKELLEAGASVTEVEPETGMTIIHLAARGGNTEVINVMLNRAAVLKIDPVTLVNIQDKFERTPFHEAVINGRIETAHFLLSRGADISAVTNIGETALHLAARYDRSDTILFLLNQTETLQNAYLVSGNTKLKRCSADPELSDVEVSEVESELGEGVATMTNAAIDEQSDLRIQALDRRNRRIGMLNAGDLNPAQRYFRDLRDDYGRTALHVAALFDRDSAAKTLLHLGSDPAVRDYYDESPLQHMVVNMPVTAREALESFTQIDRFRRRVRFYVTLLEPRPIDLEKEKTAVPGSGPSRDSRSVLEELVLRDRFKLLNDPCVSKLVDLKWDHFGRKYMMNQLMLYLLYVASWTATALAQPQYERTNYSGNIWRYGFEGVGVLLLLYFIFSEIYEFVHAAGRHVRWKKEALARLNIAMDANYIDCTWPDFEYFSLKRNEVMESTGLASYFGDYWNVFDWLGYIFLATSWGFGIYASQTSDAADRIDEARHHARLLVVGLIFSWIKILKFLRAYQTFGPFVVMLSRMLKNVRDFLLLYIDFLVPFAVGFWLLFSSTVTGYANFEDTLMSLFRMSLVDFDYDELRNADETMGPLLVAVWLFLSGVVFINLFIAMMSNTFDAVYDHSAEVSLMQRAEFVLNAQAWLTPSELNAHRNYLHDLKVLDASSDNRIQHVSYLEDPYDDPDDEPDIVHSLRQDITELAQHSANQVDQLSEKMASLELLLLRMCEKQGVDTRNLQATTLYNNSWSAPKRDSTTSSTDRGPTFTYKDMKRHSIISSEDGTDLEREQSSRRLLPERGSFVLRTLPEGQEPAPAAGGSALPPMPTREVPRPPTELPPLRHQDAQGRGRSRSRHSRRVYPQDNNDSLA